MNKQKDRLVELLQEASTEAGKHFRKTTKKVLAEKGRFNSAKDIDRRNIYEVEADYLLANGVIVPKCKVGDKVYLIDKRLSVWWQGEVIALYYAKSDGVRYSVALEGGDVLIYDDDKVFSTREEAEAKLKEGVQG